MNKKILLAGLHNTGKTTYIAALWYMLSNYDNSFPIKLGSLEHGEDEYLNRIANAWMRFEPVPRTNQAKLQGEQVIINVIDNENGETFSLDIPDFSGETFKKQFENREWDLEFQSAVEGLHGMVLFINPTDENNMPKLLQLINEIQQFYGISENNDGVQFVPYDSSHTCNQVKLIDCLQFLARYGKTSYPLKVSIVISLWDKVEPIAEYTHIPEIWVEKHLPLLHQFLTTNSETFNCCYFGISSQGGDYDQRESLAELDPMKRVRVCEGGTISNDISKPILWITK